MYSHSVVGGAGKVLLLCCSCLRVKEGGVYNAGGTLVSCEENYQRHELNDKRTNLILCASSPSIEQRHHLSHHNYENPILDIRERKGNRNRKTKAKKQGAMASTTISDLTEVRLVRRKYRWPAAQLNFWLFIVLVSCSSVLGIFASFSSIQSQLGVGTPWYVFPVLTYQLPYPLGLNCTVLG